MKKYDKGLSLKLVEEISAVKQEPSWMKEYRLNAFRVFEQSKLPNWGPSGRLKQLSFEDLVYYIRPADKVSRKWEDVPDDIRKKYDDLGIPEGEKKYLAGVGAQYESEMVYHSLKGDLEKNGVIFEEMSTAVRKYPDLVKQYFGKQVSPENNKFAALNGAIWSGGSFIYIPPRVYMDIPLHNFFQMNKPSQGQFERTVIVADEGSSVDFIEGCIAPLYSETSLHAGVVEILVKKSAKIKFTTIQNWSKNVWTMVTKRATVEEGGAVEWVDGNVGSGLVMKYPAVDLAGKGAKARIMSLVFAGEDQIIDSGGKISYLAPYTEGLVESKSLLKKGGRSSFRGKVTVSPKAERAKSRVECVSLLLDEGCRSDTYPDVKVENSSASVSHESSVLKITEDQLMYLQSRGISESAAKRIIVGGFIEPITNSLPMEYAVEFDRLIDLELHNGVG